MTLTETKPYPVTKDVVDIDLNQAFTWKHEATDEIVLDRTQLIKHLHKSFSELLVSGADRIAQEKNPIKALENFYLELAEPVFKPAPKTVAEFTALSDAMGRNILKVQPIDGIVDTALDKYIGRKLDIVFSASNSVLTGDTMQLARDIEALQVQDDDYPTINTDTSELRSELAEKIKIHIAPIYADLALLQGDFSAIRLAEAEFSKSVMNNYGWEIYSKIFEIHEKSSTREMLDDLKVATVYSQPEELEAYISKKRDSHLEELNNIICRLGYVPH